MSRILMVTGGARSGKSRFAEQLVKNKGNNVIFIATAIAIDNQMEHRIKRHREARPVQWETIEQYKGFEGLSKHQHFWKADTLLFDCLTIMITNIMIDSGLDFDKCSMKEVDQLEVVIYQEIMKLLDVVREYKKQLIIVTNELGMGLVPTNSLGSYFRDIAGRMNQIIANHADEVYFTVSGIPMKIK